MSKPIQRSFAAGEIAEELFARVDLAKRQTGLALCRNFWVLPHGPAQNCPGSKYVLDVKDSTNKVRLRGFAFSDTQTMALEFGAGWIRFHTAGGTLLEAAKNIEDISTANPAGITITAHGYQNGEWVFLTGISGAFAKLNGRFVKVKNRFVNTFEITDLNGANINTTGFGANYNAGGGTAARVYEIANPYAAADLFDLHFTQKADVMTIVHPGYPPAELRRLGATNWTLTNIAFVQPTVANVNALVTYAAAGADNNNLGAAGANLYEYKITFVMAGTQEESIAYRPRRWVSKGSVLAVNGATNANPGVFQTTGAHGLAVNDPVIVSGIGGLSGRFATFIGAINSVPDATHFTLKDLVTNTPVDTSALSPFGSNGSAQRLGNAISAATNANPGVFTTSDANHFLVVGDPVIVEGVQGMGGNLSSYTGVVASTPSITTFTLNNVDGTTLDTTAFGAYTGGGVIRILGAKTDLTVAGNTVTVKLIAAPLPTGVIRFNVYKKLNGLFGFIGQASTDGKFVDNNIAPDMGRTPGEASNLFSAADDYPGAVGYYEGRRTFAGTNNKPLLLAATKSGTESNTTFSIPSRDDDAIILSILSAEAARIRHIVPLDILVLLTALGVWKVAPVNSDILTPSSAKPKLLTGGGASNVQPVLSGAAVLFPAAQGGRVRELKYKADANFIAAYQTTDISVMAPHLFDGFTIVDAAYAETPYRMAFFVRSDGVLLGLTYLPEHDVAAWWQRTTDGLFESVAAVLEGNETVLYCMVNRQGVRKVEIFSTRRFATLADSFFVDSGVSLTIGGPFQNITGGLWHLEGKTVSILADGAVMPQQVVTNGGLPQPLDTQKAKVHIGLPIVADMQTMPIAVEGAPAFGMANLKNINEAWIRIKDTSNLKVGPDFNTMRVAKQRTNEPMGSPPALKSGVVNIVLDGKWVDDAPICIRQDQPLPCTVESIALGVRDGG